MALNLDRDNSKRMHSLTIVHGHSLMTKYTNNNMPTVHAHIIYYIYISEQIHYQDTRVGLP